MFASAANGLGAVYAVTGLTDSAIVYFKLAADAYRLANQHAEAASAQLNLAVAYKNRGLYDFSLRENLPAIKYLESQPPGRELASAYNNIALVYTKMQDYASALKYHRLCLVTRHQLNLPSLVAQSYNNIGGLFLLTNNTDSAAHYYQLALQLKKELHDPLAVVLNNLGEVDLLREDYRSARSYFNKSLTLKQAAQDYTGQVVTLKNLGKLELLTGNFRQAEGFLNQGKILATQTNSLEYLRDILFLLADVYSKTGQFKNAFDHNQQLIAVKDSLLNKEKAIIISELQTRFETEKKEQQLLLMQQENQLQEANLKQQNAVIALLLIGILLGLVILVLVWINARNTRQSKQRVEMLMRELQHRVKNNLQLLSGIFTLQSRNLKDASAIALAKGSQSRVNAIAMIHRELSGNRVDTRVSMESYVRELVEGLKSAYHYEHTEPLLQFELQDLQLDVEKAMPLGLIINELVTNSFKYAFPGTTNPQLRISMKMENEMSLLLQVSDNGHQVKDVTYYESTRSFGLNMVRTLVRELRGKLEIHLQNGTHFHLHIPLAA